MQYKNIWFFLDFYVCSLHFASFHLCAAVLNFLLNELLSYSIRLLIFLSADLSIYLSVVWFHFYFGEYARIRSKKSTRTLARTHTHWKIPLSCDTIAANEKPCNSNVVSFHACFSNKNDSRSSRRISNTKNMSLYLFKYCINNSKCVFKRRTIHVLDWRLIILCYIRNATEFSSCTFFSLSFRLTFYFRLCWWSNLCKFLLIRMNARVNKCVGIGAKKSINWSQQNRTHPRNIEEER